MVGALADAVTEDETWVIGGAEIYRLALPTATRCEVTEIDIDLERRRVTRWRRPWTLPGSIQSKTGYQ